MNIFLLSVTDNLDPDLCQVLEDEIKKRGNRVAYISSAPQTGDRPYYISTINDYRAISKNVQVDYFDLSEDFSDDQLQLLLTYGTIYLSGGNTYVFMDSANKRNILPILKRHMGNGGLLIGASAGSIMMTPSIDLAEHGDENIPQITNTTGFGFVDFEFHPHFNNTEQELKYLSQHKNKKKLKIYTCKDGGGILIAGNAIKLFGSVSEFINPI